RQPAWQLAAAGSPVGIRAPLVRIDRPVDAKPYRRAVVAVVLDQVESTAQLRGPAHGIDHPARLDREGLAVALEVNSVRRGVTRQRDGSHARAVDEGHAELAGALPQVVLENAA